MRATRSQPYYTYFIFFILFFLILIIPAQAATPVANFTANVTSGTAPLPVSFTDLSLNGPTGWAWFFGDENFTEPWTQVNASAGWTARLAHSSVVMPDGSIVLMGGSDIGSYKNDVWRSTDNGATWTQVNTSAGWTARYAHRSVALPDGSIVLMGGYDGSDYKNDTWRSTDNGATWTLVNASAGWTGRVYPGSIAMPDGSIVLMGGFGNGGETNDTWRSTDNGATWTLVNASAGWTPRDSHSTVAMPDGNIVLMGGYDGSDKNDTWRSTDNGATWTLVNASAGWTARELHSSVAMPDGSIVLMGGQDVGYTNDVWRSMNNGATWTLVNASAGWTARARHSSVAMPDGSIVLMGGAESSGTRKNDVWRFMPAGSTLENPSHTYTTPGNFSVALQAYNAGGYNSTQKAGYITVGAAAESTPAIDWQKSLGGSGTDRGYQVEQTSDNGYIVVGRSDSSDGDLTINFGFDDIWLAKLTSTGDIDWQQSYGGMDEDWGFAVRQTSDGGYIFGGYTKSSNGDVGFNYGLNDFWVVKTDEFGSIQWANPYGGSDEDMLSDLDTTSDGGYIVVGSTSSTDFDVSDSYGGGDIWVVKLDEFGSIDWQKSLGGSGLDNGNAIRQTSDGGYIVAGTSDSTDNDVTGNHGGSDYWVVKLDEFGSIDWEKSLGGSGYDGADSVQQTADGGYIVFGSTDSSDGDVTGYHGNTDYWVVKLDSGGNIDWEKALGGSGGEYVMGGRSLTETDDGSYVVTGASGSNDGDRTGACGDQTGFPGYDFWTVKLGSGGDIIWQLSLGGTNADQAKAVATTDDGYLILSGNSESDNNDVSGNHGGADYWVAKLAAPDTPTAGIDAEVVTGTAPFMVHFIDASSGTPTFWNWSFGDGDNTNSTRRNPYHLYTNPGTYTVSLTVNNSAAGTGYTQNVDYITVNSPPAPVAGFTANVTFGTVPLAVNFTDLSTNTPTSWNWSFGDGNFSISQNPAHLYEFNGTFTVSLNATNAGGSNISTRTNYITVTVPKPIPDFSANVTSGAAPLPVSFTDSSLNNPTGWAWFFGDENFTEPWMQVTGSAGWLGRWGHTSVAMPDGSIVMMGGSDNGGYKNDTWRSTDNGATWTQMTSSASWSGRRFHTSVAMPDGSIVMMGGYDGSNRKNDTWRSTDNGATWTQMTASAGWSGRYGHSSCMMPDGSIVLMGGGATSESIKNDTWRSTDNGATWTQMTASAGWSVRWGHTSVAMPDGSIVLMGGWGDYNDYTNDVWRSTDNGATWTQMTASAGWPAREAHTSVAMPDGSIVMMGGSDSGGYKNDTWRSMDEGATWTQINMSAEWTARTYHSSVAMPDGSIVLMGGYDYSYDGTNDVWRFMPTGSSVQDPSHTYTAPGSYQVALQVYNTGGYNSTRKAGYINVTSGATTGPVHNLNSGLNYPTIQFAIDNATALDTILVDSGTYFENVDINKPLTLRGNETGSGPPVVDAGGSGSAVSLNADNITFDGFVTTNAGPVAAGINVVLSRNSTIINNTATSNAAVGVYVYYSSNTRLFHNNVSFNTLRGIGSDDSFDNFFVNNTVNNNTGDGIYLGNSSHNRIDNNTLIGNGEFGIVLFTSSDNNLINNNTVDSNGFSGTYPGIMLGSPSDPMRNVTGNIVYNNTLTNNTGEGLVSGWSEGNVIYDNIIFSNGWHGIAVEGSRLENVSSNIIWNNSRDGIRLITSNDTILSGNTITGNLWNGVYLYDYNENTTVSDNTISGNNYDGIFLQLSDRNTIINNTVEDSALYHGIALNLSHRNTLQDNRISNNTLNGIWLGDSSDNRIINNSLLDNSMHGILLDNEMAAGCNNNTLSQNNASFNHAHGFYIFSSVNNTLSGNIAVNNSQNGMFIHSSSNNSVSSNTLRQNTLRGVALNASFNNMLYNNTILFNPLGLGMSSGSSNNTIYNNYFNNTVNVGTINEVNIWNTTKTSGTNIIGGSWIAGNFWSDYAGVDTDSDGIGDTLVPHTAGGAIIYGGDWLPLTNVTGSLPPVASFTANVTSGLAPFAVNFTDLSTNTPDAWNWSFGDGNFSVFQNPGHLYEFAGTFTVSLNATNAGGSNVSVRTNYIVVTVPKPIPDFSVNVTSGTVPLPVSFTDLSLNNPTGWAWFFGDETYDEPWTQVSANAGWSARGFFSSVAMPDGSIVLMGGSDPDRVYNDVWRSTDNGATWTQVNASAGWTARHYHTSVTMPDGSIVLMGGRELGLFKNDVWRSTDNGATWSLMNASAGWTARWDPISVAMPDGSIVLMGGYDWVTLFNDTWRSTDNGATWSLVNGSSGWTARMDHTSVAMPDGSIILMGGGDSSDYKNDTWRSTNNGVTWTLVNASSGWTARLRHSSIAMPDGSIVLMGGNDGDSRKNDVWQSTDNGATWSLVNASAGWTERELYTSVAMPDGSIVLLGGFDGANYYNDTWRFTPTGSSLQNPLHVYTTAGTYNVSLQAYHADGYNSTRKISYINVTSGVTTGPVHNFNSGLNYPGIQLAIENATALDTILVDSGTYYENVNITKPLTLRGNETGSGPPVVDAGGSGSAVTLNADNVTLDWFVATNSEDGVGPFAGIYVQGNYSTVSNVSATNNGQYGIFTVNAHNNTIISSFATWNTDNGIFLDDSTNTTIIDNTLHSNGGEGLVIFSQSHNNTVFDNLAYNNSKNGFIISDSSNFNTLTANNASFNAFDGISVTDSSYNELQGNTALNNSISGFNIESTANITLVSNLAKDNLDRGIYLQNSCSNTSIQSNSVTSNIGDGILIENSNTTFIYNNTVTGNLAGIELSVSPNTTILGNTVSDSNSFGIGVLISSHFSTVISNSVHNNTGDGIQIHNSSYTSVTANNASFNSMNGILIHDLSFSNTIDNNVISGNADIGIYVFDFCDDNTFVNNSITDSAVKGIYFEDSNNNEVYNNYFNNTINAFDGNSNIWNTTKTSGTNIIGGSWIAGNFWSDYAGVDTDSDGIGDTAVPYNTGITIGGDWLPLTNLTGSLPPVASFTANVTSGTAPLAVNFTDLSTNTPTSWNWSFGDGNFSILQNPAHLYEFAGTFTVSLNATNAGGSNVSVRTNYITITVPKPIPDFSANVTSGAAPLPVSFTDLSLNNPTGWAWYFGDENFTEPWTEMTASAGWTARYLHTSVAMPDGTIVLMGGNDGGLTNDVWRSADNGATWTEVNASAGWTARYIHTSVAMPDGSIVLMGGYGGVRKNDVWRSTDNGATWTEVNASAGWTARDAHTSVAMPDGSIVLMGGNSGASLNDVWRSADNGATWTQMTASAGWTARYLHTSVAMPDGSIVLMGGWDGGVKNDVWRSADNGATWTQVNASAGWTARYDHSSVAMPDGSIVLTGGNSGVPLNDVWRSTDNGNIWTEVNASAGWTARYDHSSVAMPDGSIVLTGGNDGFGSNMNDVWRLMPAGSSAQDPSHTYTSSGTYNVTLQAYNTGGYNSTQKVGYVTVTAGLTTGPVHNIDTNLNFTTIQAAINDTATLVGHTIHVDSGTYDEQVIVSKSLTLRGNDTGTGLPSISTSTTGGAVILSAGSTTFDRFTVRATGVTTDGIVILSDNNIVRFNNISSNTRHGIYINGGDHNNVLNNTLDYNVDGIRINQGNFTTVANNTASANSGNGIGILSSSDNTLQNNNLTGNAVGIWVFTASGPNTILRNSVTGSSVYGIQIDDSAFNIIYDNSFTNTNNAITNSENIWNITKTAGTNIIGGSFIGGNYWSDYTGLDTDSDGIGNTLLPYTAGGSVSIGGDFLPLTSLTGSAPVANFAANTTAGTAPLAVLFTDTSTNTPTIWNWSFGDNNFSAAQNPVHIYTFTGLFTVNLTASNTAGNNTLVRSNYVNVTVSGSAPVANFIANVTSGTAPLPVQFTDSSTNSPTAWNWSFGDGNFSALSNPAYIYNLPGTYTVNLTASNAFGNDTFSRSNYVTVSPSPLAPLANFTADITEGCAPLIVQFNDTSTNSPTSWSWDFGDGDTSTGQDPVHEFESGVYTITLTATNAAGSTQKIRSEYIIVHAASHTLSFDIIGLSAVGSSPQQITLNLTDFGGPVNITGNLVNATFLPGADFQHMTLYLDPVNVSAGNVTGNLSWAWFHSRTLDADLPSHGLQKPFFEVHVIKVPLPTDAVEVQIIKCARSAELIKFQAAAAASGYSISDIGYVMHIESNVSSSIIEGADITERVPASWADTYGTGNIRILRIDQYGSPAILSTTFAGYDGADAVFTAISPDEFSTFAVSALAGITAPPPPPPPPSDGGGGDSGSGDSEAPPAEGQQGQEQQGAPQQQAPPVAPEAPAAPEALASQAEQAAQSVPMGFEGMSFNAEGDNSLSIDMGQADAVGATVTVYADHVTVYQCASPGVLITFWSDNLQIKDRKIKGTVKKAEFVTDPLIANLTMGSVSGSVRADLPALTQRVTIDNTINGNVSGGIREQFRSVLAQNDFEMGAVAYTMTIHRVNLPRTGVANVTLTLPPLWVEGHGGQDSVQIARISEETGRTELINTVYTGRDPKGNMVFRGDSPNGTSVFGMLTAKATAEKVQEQPDVTIQPFQKPALMTDVGMFAWLLGIAEQNPVVVLIIIAVLGVVLYFGWWNRRL